MSQRFAALEELGQRFEGLGKTPRRASSRRLLPAISAAGVSLAAVIVAAVVLLSTGTPAAYAGWSRVPRDAKAAAVNKAIKKCYRVSPSTPRLGQPVLAESRGRSTAAVYVKEGTVYLCLYNAQYGAVGSYSMGPLRAAPNQDQLSIPYGVWGGGGHGRIPNKLFEALRRRPVSRATDLAFDRFRASVGGGYYALGQVGGGVSTVKFAFANRKTVVATVEHGWYFAWWPWTTDPTSVTVQDGAGIATARMRNAFPHEAGSRPWSVCKPGSSGCLFVKLADAKVAPAPAPANVSRRVANMIRSCDALTMSSENLPAQVFAGRPILSDLHGKFAAILSVANKRIYLCMIGGNQKNFDAFYAEHIGGYGQKRETPAPGRISVPYAENTGNSGGRFGPFANLVRNGHRPTQAEMEAVREVVNGGGYGPYALGEVGHGVSEIRFGFANGKSVSATISNGFYLAWWPWTSRPTSVAVTTASGTITSDTTGSDSGRTDLAQGCKPGAPGCVFVRTPGAP